MTLSDAEITTYLSGALDQVACKDTLRGALLSRVDSLASQGISSRIICRNLVHMCEDPYQINDDVIREIVDQLATIAAS